MLSGAAEQIAHIFDSGSVHYYVICAFCVVVLLTGGSARPDVLSLPLLRPVAVMVAAFGLTTLRREHVARHRFLFAMTLALALLVLLHLVPLPPALWRALPGRDMIVAIDDVTGLGALWRPLSMAPELSWNAFYALSVPFAVLICGVQLSADELRRLALVLVAGCAASSLLALLQLLGSPDGPLYLYRITNQGAAVGFFANRNHQALFLAAALPMLAAYAAPRGRSRSEDRRHLFVCIVLTLLILPLLLVTGSRAGLLVGALGLISMPLVYRSGVRIRRSKNPRARLWWALALAGVTIAAAFTILSGRAEALRRLLLTIPGQELRYEKWVAVVDHLTQFLPFGSGAGTYEPVFEMIEPSALLASSYSNHAHNDWLEILLTTGFPGAALLAVAIVVFGISLARQAWRRTRSGNAAFGWAGITIVLMVALASAVDYPLRTPTIAALFVIACLWARLGHTASADGAGSAVNAPLNGEGNRSGNA